MPASATTKYFFYSPVIFEWHDVPPFYAIPVLPFSSVLDWVERLMVVIVVLLHLLLGLAIFL